MAALVVGGVTIPVAVSGNKRPRSDMVDRVRAFDGTYRASATGTAKRDWTLQTSPIPRATSDTIEATLFILGAQACSGDILGGSVSCFVEVTGWSPIVVQGGHYVVVDFILHEA